MAIFEVNPPLASVLYIFYLLLLSGILTQLRFFRDSGLSRPQLVLIFLLKVAAGTLYAWMGIYYGKTAYMTDTWYFHESGIQEKTLLLEDPLRFFRELFQDPYDDGRWKLLGTENSYWNDLKGNALIKGLALLNLISGGHYLINVLFFNFLGMIGVTCFYRVLTHRFPYAKFAAGSAAWLLPSVLFWTSGIHKEGILFTALGCITYLMYFSFANHLWSVKRIGIVFISLLLLLIFRNHLLIALLPALILWLILEQIPKRRGLVSMGIYSVFLLIFFLSPYLSPKTNLPAAVARKQQEFLALKGNSSLSVDRLEPTPLGFLKNLPQAIDLSLTRPHFQDVQHLLPLSAYMEVLLYGVLLLIWIRFRKTDPKNPWPSQPVDFFMISFSISVILIIGFSINNLGAIVRYRSIILTPLLAPLLANINWKKILHPFKQ